jgi:uracil DNA glycosylase
MIITHVKKDEEINLRVDYTQLLGDWVKPLKDYLNTEYQSNLMFDIYKKYNNKFNLNKNWISKKDVFKPYLLTPPDKIKVVIINCNFKFTKRSNGLAFGNIEKLGEEDYDDELISLFKTIEDKDHDGLNVNMDYTLESWAKQGVLLLNYGLYTDSEVDRMRTFKLIVETIKFINENYTGVIFYFVNNSSNMFISNVNQKVNHLRTTTSPYLNYNVLNDINEIIEKQNGKNFRIRW